MKSAFTKNLTLISIFILFSLSSSAFAQWEKNIIDANLTNATVLYVEDIDGDGDLDIAETSWTDADVVWYENDGSNLVWTKHTIDGNIADIVGVHVADINGDTKMDVIAAGYGVDDVVWYENNGGVPISWTKYTIDGSLDGANIVYVADIDRDNDLDVVATGNIADDVVWYENDGESPISWTKHSIDENLDDVRQIRVADIDGDDDLDVTAAGYGTDDIVWYENNLPEQNWAKHTIDGNLDGAIGMSVADIDGDGDLDVAATGEYADDVVWYENNHPDTIWNKYIIDGNLKQTRGLDFADIDGDNIPDAVASSSGDNDVVWYKNNLPDSNWTKHIIDESLGGARMLFLADLNEDTFTDVIANGQSANDVVWYKNPFSPQTIEDSFEFEGLERDYIVYLPSNFQPDMPLVINLHGSLPTDAEWMLNYTQMNEIADTAGFVAVYPNSISPRWNANSGITTVSEPNVNDVGFISNLIDTLIQRYEVDTNRIYCCGVNYGGWMASELFCQIGHRFAAGARVNTSLGISQADRSILDHPFPIVLFNGTADTYLPWPNGGNGKMGGEEAINWWVEQNECELNADTVSLPDLDPTDNCTVEKISYTDCANETRVVFYKVINGGLSWPGAVGNETWDKPRNMDINASVEIWNFFKDFTKSEETSAEAWTKKADIPTARVHASSCEIDGKIYVLGGDSGSGQSITNMEVYNSILDSWETNKAEMPTSRLELGACALNGKIYAIGGAQTHSGPALGTVEEYDPLSDSWTTKTPKPAPRKGAAYGVINNKIYVAGGTAASYNVASNKLEIYDPSTDTWDVTKSAMLKAVYVPGGAVFDGKFYVVGGLIGSPWIGQKTVQIYDPVSDTWSYGPDLLEGRAAPTANVVDGKLYVIGGDTYVAGETQKYSLVPSVEEFDPNSNSWEIIDQIPFGTTLNTSCVLGNEIYLISGSTTPYLNLTWTSAVYSYNPQKSPTAVESNNNLISDAFILHQNYPNPFNPSTTIKYSIPIDIRNEIGDVRLIIYDILGRKIKTLVSEKQKPGNYEVKWNGLSASGGQVPSGIYFSQLTAGEFVETKKLVVLK